MINTNPELLELCFDKVLHTAGVFVEIGVYKGDTFQFIAREAKLQGKKSYAFDSFAGMGEPSEFDIDPRPNKPQYPKGKFDTGGFQHIINLLSGLELNKDYFIIDGFVPETFKRFPENEKIAFVYLDVDHHQPTVDSLDWLWNKKLALGGILLCDDFPKNTKIFAAKAIKEFMDKEKPYIFGMSEDKIAFIKQ
jgi:hypothetical protein